MHAECDVNLTFIKSWFALKIMGEIDKIEKISAACEKIE